jgi:hypothetical protein
MNIAGKIKIEFSGNAFCLLASQWFFERKKITEQD